MKQSKQQRLNMLRETALSYAKEELSEQYFENMKALEASKNPLQTLSEIRGFHKIEHVEKDNQKKEKPDLKYDDMEDAIRKQLKEDARVRKVEKPDQQLDTNVIVDLSQNKRRWPKYQDGGFLQVESDVELPDTKDQNSNHSEKFEPLSPEQLRLNHPVRTHKGELGAKFNSEPLTKSQQMKLALDKLHDHNIAQKDSLDAALDKAENKLNNAFKAGQINDSEHARIMDNLHAEFDDNLFHIESQHTLDQSVLANSSSPLTRVVILTEHSNEKAEYAFHFKLPEDVEQSANDKAEENVSENISKSQSNQLLDMSINNDMDSSL